MLSLSVKMLTDGDVLTGHITNLQLHVALAICEALGQYAAQLDAEVRCHFF